MLWLMAKMIAIEFRKPAHAVLVDEDNGEITVFVFPGSLQDVAFFFSSLGFYESRKNFAFACVSIILIIVSFFG